MSAEIIDRYKLIIPCSSDKFVEICKELTDHSVGTLQSKGKEYAPGVDRFKNFNETALITGLTPGQVMFLYFVKHFEAVKNVIVEGNSYEWCWRTADNNEGLKQRIADKINYLYFQFVWLELVEEYKKLGVIDIDTLPPISTITSYLQKLGVCDREGI